LSGLLPLLWLSIWLHRLTVAHRLLHRLSIAHRLLHWLTVAHRLHGSSVSHRLAAVTHGLWLGHLVAHLLPDAVLHLHLELLHLRRDAVPNRTTTTVASYQLRLNLDLRLGPGRLLLDNNLRLCHRCLGSQCTIRMPLTFQMKIADIFTLVVDLEPLINTAWNTESGQLDYSFSHLVTGYNILVPNRDGHVIADVFDVDVKPLFLVLH